MQRFLYSHRSKLPALSALAAVTLQLSTAQAVPCADLDLPNPIYGSGGSAITATLGKVATALAGLDEPITVLFADPGACTGYQAFLDDAITTPLKYWDADGTQQQCDPPAVVGQPVDFAHMGNPADQCAGQTLPEDVGDFLGPVQTLNIITSVDSSETSISAEALYFIYGWGADSEAAPWNVEANLAKRKSDSFVHLFLANSIGLGAEKFKGTQVADNQGSVTLIVDAAATDPDSTLGYVSGSTADKNRATVKTLAYQHTGQSCGYWPDSDENSYDKINVRKGLYHFWAPGHFFARVDADGKIVDPRVEQFVSWFQGTEPGPEDTDITKIIAKAGDVPSCAMQVTREGVVGAISSYAPAQPCGCYFEFVTTGETSCESCSEGDPSENGQVCRNGYWEAY
ncbi:MAG TPA: hypothetical protein VHM70_23035 [Polyangiaceae bacterium]|jgi:hypothetical protein|nr:hypothetical protein [Polyangiaceae bacterium]